MSMKLKQWMVMCMGALASASVLAYSAGAQVTCVSNGDSMTATMNLTVTPNASDLGLPGLVYVALVPPDGSDNIYLDGSSNTWSMNGGNQPPVARLARSGLSNVSFTADITQYLNSSYSLYVGYGALTADMESQVQVRRTALNQMKAQNPDRSFYDPGDDYVRRMLVDADIRKQNRYWQVLRVIQCAS